jgi:chain length determinant protein tyrosine kinase EpsG
VDNGQVTDTTDALAAPADQHFISPVQGDERNLGGILVQSGRLKKEDALRVSRFQQKKGLRFGDAAVKLGVVSEVDVQFALARQFDFHMLKRGDDSGVSEHVVAAYEPTTPRAEALRALRSQLLLRWFDAPPQPHQALAIVGTDRGVGRSWVSANLAVVFSQLGRNTLLIDADLRHPCQHQLFGFTNRYGVAEVLSGRATLIAALQSKPVLRDLVVLTAGAMPPNPQDMLTRGEFGELLQALKSTFDVILIDTPSAGECADGQVIAMQAGGALLIARRDLSRAVALQSYAHVLRETRVQLVGSVLNGP